jgi:CBS domain containing-hemolysin-like protein
MLRDVLALADRPVQTIMTPRPELAWIDPKETVLAEVRNSAHRQFLVSPRIGGRCRRYRT